MNNLRSRLGEALHIDFRYFVVGSGWLAFAVGIGYAMGLLRSVAFARLAPSEVYGQYSFVLAAVGMLSVVTLSGVSTALTQAVAQGKYGSFFDAVKIRAVWGSLGSIVVILFGLGYAYYQTDIKFLWAFTAVALFVPFTSCTDLITAYYQGVKRFDLVSWLNSGAIILTTAGLAIGLWAHLDFVWLLVINSLASLLVPLVLYRSVITQARSSPVDPDLFSYSWSLSVANAIGTMAFYLDSVMLGFFSSFNAVALYRIAAVLPENSKVFFKIMTSLLMPKLAETTDRKFYGHNNRNRMFLLLGLNITVVAMAIVLIPYIILLLYGQAYSQSAIYAQGMFLSMGLSGVDAVSLAVLQAQKRADVIFRANLLYGVLQISSLIILVPRLGIGGIVISYIISRWAIGLYRWRAIRHL
ncbi:MAG: oligosaccharide flippase family protein [Anaerolineaceae bacterium]|nr:oligosaccharide flippase family protein [Anaerolineaceae bacterium]MCB9102233.1 oligosaccharide flippase family protein [Anaerolineales bacterium]